MSKGIVKSSKSIQKKLEERFKELKLKYTDISKEATRLGQKISVPSLSKYFSNSEKNNLSEENIIFLCYRYGIFVTLHLGEIKVMPGGKIAMLVPPYNEQRCLTVLNKIFPYEQGTGSGNGKPSKTKRLPLVPKGKRVHSKKSTEAAK